MSLEQLVDGALVQDNFDKINLAIDQTDVNSGSVTRTPVKGDSDREVIWQDFEDAYTLLTSQTSASAFTMRALELPAVDYYWPDTEDLVFDERVSFICNNGDCTPINVTDIWASNTTFSNLWTAHLRASTILLEGDGSPTPVHYKNISFNADLTIKYNSGALFNGCKMHDVVIESEGGAGCALTMKDSVVQGNVNPGIDDLARLRNSGFNNCIFFGDFLMDVDNDILAGISTPNFIECAFRGDTNFVAKPGFLATPQPVKAHFKDCSFDSLEMFDFTSNPSSVDILFENCTFSGNEATWFSGYTVGVGEVEFRNCYGVHTSVVATNATILWSTDNTGAVIPNQ